VSVATPSLLRDLLPPLVAVAEGAIDTVAGTVWPEEAEQVARAVARKRAEFAAGRVLARRALLVLGGPQGPIRRGDAGAPEWPSGFTGSITHTRDYAAAAVASLEAIAGVGIDAEETRRLTRELEAYMFTPDEILRSLTGRDPEEWQAMAALMFCAKEAYYKAQRPLTGQWLNFPDVEVDVDPRTGDFEAWRVLRPATRLAGRCAIVGDLAAAALCISPEESGRL
jgi:4'-phosphopantetheinyl transferase EntD